jgi:hypothetical protein
MRNLTACTLAVQRARAGIEPDERPTPTGTARWRGPESNRMGGGTPTDVVGSIV